MPLFSTANPMVSMPWSPTRSYPHPLANIQSSNANSPTTNLLSYALVELVIWYGLGDLVNVLRTRTLGLEPVGSIWGAGLIPRLHVPYMYCW
jgi:hypothetical protein